MILISLIVTVWKTPLAEEDRQLENVVDRG
jgi:hypothetical protein